MAVTGIWVQAISETWTQTASSGTIFSVTGVWDHAYSETSAWSVLPWFHSMPAGIATNARTWTNDYAYRLVAFITTNREARWNVGPYTESRTDTVSGTSLATTLSMRSVCTQENVAVSRSNRSPRLVRRVRRPTTGTY